MQIERQPLKGMHEQLILTLEPNDYTQDVTNKLKKLRFNAEVPGFRKGYAPMQLIEKKYKHAAIIETIDEIASKTLTDFIENNHISLLTKLSIDEDELSKINSSNTENITLHYDMVVIPDIDISFDKNDKLTLYNIVIKEDDVQKIIEEYRRRYGMLNSVNTIGEEDHITADFEEIPVSQDCESKPLIVENAVFLMKFVKNNTIKGNLINKKVGDSLVFSPKEAFENESETKFVLGIKDNNHMDSQFKCTIKEIKRLNKQEIGEDFFKKFGNNITNIDELKQTIKNKEIEKNEYYTNIKFENDVIELLFKKIDNIDLPTDILFKNLSQDNNSEEIDKRKSEYLRYFRFEMITRLLINKYHLEISEDEIKEKNSIETLMRFSDYGMDFLNEDILQNITSQPIPDEQKDKLFYRVLLSKIAKLAKENANVTIEDISLDEFLKK